MNGWGKESSSIPISKEVSAGIEKQTTFLSQQGITKEAFQKAVQEKIDEGRISFLLAVYQTLDEFLEQEIRISEVTLACKKGCSQCCHTLITSTEMEMDEIIHFINRLPNQIRFPLIRRLRGFAREWRDYYRQHELSIERNPFRPTQDWQGKPCPFLDEGEGSCSIYPVRIIDCRSLTSLITCTFPVTKPLIPCELRTEGPGRYRFQCEIWANSLIMDEQRNKLGVSNLRLPAVTPVHHWLWIKSKEF